MSLSDALVAPLSHRAVSDNDPSDVDMRSTVEAGQPRLIAEEDEEMEDLFGEHNEHNVQQPERDTSPSEGDAGQLDTISDAEQRHREAMEYAEPEDLDQDPNSLLEQHTEANAAIPNIPIPKSSDGQNWVIRMPNFVKVDSKPFHPDTYIGPEQEEDDIAVADSVRERSMSIKLKVENTLRWRWIKDGHGNDQRQSNSRVIRWSDGTLSLLLGKELFDISQQVDNSLANPRTTINAAPQQSQSQSSEPLGPSSQSSSAGAKNQGLTYLVAQHKRAEILQSEALVTGYMTLRPTGMQSETHRMLVRAVGQKHNKVARLRMAPDPTTDPEREKLELLKSSAKSKAKKPRYEDDGLGGAGGSAGSRRRRSYSRKRGDGVWSDDDEEEDDAEHDVFGAGSDDDDDDLTAGRSSRSRKKGKRSKVPADARTGGDYQTDDFVVSDSPSDDGGGDSETGKSSKKKRKRRNKSEELEDDLDKLEAKIEEAERMRENAPLGDEHASTEQVPEAEEMDVESEEPDEEEEEHQVRKVGAAGGGRTRRLALELEEEEEE